jgi:pilus assembly protein CpaB
MTTTIPITDTPPSRVARKFRIRAVIFLIAAIAAGVAALFLVKAYLDQVRRSAPPAPLDTVEVVITRTDVALGQRLQPGDLALVPWPAAHAPAGAFKRLEQVVGHTARQALVAGEPLLPTRLVTGAQGEGLASLLEPGGRAMAVKVDQVVGIAGFVQPGDRVDVIATLVTDEETKNVLATDAEKMAKTILEDIRVLAVGEHLATEGTKPIKVQVVTLAVFPDEAERLALASQHGTIQLTMRARVDHTEVATAGISPLGLLAPDPGATPLMVGKAPVTTPSPGEPAARRVTRTTAARTRPPVTPAVAREPEAVAPVVEILRGTQKIEQRKLRPPGGAP